MAMFYEKEGIVEAFHMNGVLTVKWQKVYISSVIRECCLAQLERVKEGARVIIVDVSEAAGKPSDEMQEWFKSTLFPEYRNHGLKALINVIPKSPTTRTAAGEWRKSGELFGFATFETTSLIMARKKAREFV